MNNFIFIYAVSVLCVLCNSSYASEYIWLEGEKPSRQNFQVQGTGWGNKHYLSEESWLNISIPENEVKSKVPEDGIILSYDFELSDPDKYEVWNRIGYEFVRSIFHWRIDDAPWKEIKPDEFTIDLMDISLWCEVAWLKMGDVQLSAGKHTLIIRLPLIYKEGNKEPQRILYASDALCIYKGNFRPNGKYKPDDQWQTDIDHKAGDNIFQMPSKLPEGERFELSLNGIWQIARYDEPGLVENRTGPIENIPSEELYWKGISVPGDRNRLRPEMYFCHRYFYRTKVNIPEELRGRSMFLDFTENSMLTTVFVNGKQVAFHDAPFTGFKADITSTVKYGEVNEIWVGIKDSYYAIEPNSEKPNARYWFNTPSELMGNQGITMRFDYPMFGHSDNGILDSVKLIATGDAYTEDAYIITSVKNSQISLEITVKNPTNSDLTLQMDNEITPINGGKAEKKFSSRLIDVPAGQSIMVKLTEDWKNPHLWWPDDPYQYYAITYLSLNGKIIDTCRTKFGFREWGIQGTRFVLNGVPWQLRANLDYNDAGPGSEEKAVEWWQKSGQNMFRFRFQRKWCGMTPQKMLDFFDSHGVPVRRTCSTFDGQMASYGLVDFIEKDGKKVKISRKPLFDNWRKQIAARIRQERNHPSVFVWELDNEIIFINTRNLGNLDVVEPEFKEAAKLVQEMDHQGRGVMIAGGRALLDQSLPINGCHYEASPDREYPDMAYGLGKWTAHNNWTPWPMALDKPIFLSEEFFASGRKPSGFAGVGGEICFLGRAETKDACGLLAKMYSEGYRWQELGAFHYWFGNYGTAHYNSWQPVLALCREWNWTFGGNTKVKRTIMVRNDTRFDSPIDMQWEFILDDRPLASHRRTYSIRPGHGEITEVILDIPEVQERTPGQFILTCYRENKEIWREKKDLWVINTSASNIPEFRPGDLIIWDPEGSVTAYLKHLGIGFTSIRNPEEIPDQFEVMIIGKDALSARQSTDQLWYSLAAQGKKILVMDQKFPLRYQAVPADFEITDYTGRIAFAENLEHPIFQGLNQSDFFCWSGDHIVYRNAYMKASRGARSLVQCDDELSCSALAECPVNEGLMMLCQMAVGEKLGSDPVARRLFDNMLNYVFRYRLIKNNTALVMSQDDLRTKLLEQSQLKYKAFDDLITALQDRDNNIVIVDAKAGNLRQLVDNKEKLDNFTRRGGYLMLWGLTPDGLADFNKLVGFNHTIRPFRREKVELAAIRDPLSSGLSQRDVVLLSGERIFGWTQDEYVADDVFTYIVDLEDIAPFMKGPGIEGTASIVNGFTGVDAWKYIVYFTLDENNKAQKLEYELPKPETIIGFSIVPNSHYNLIKKLRLIFDNDLSNSLTIDLADYDRGNNERQDFDIPERRCEKKLAIEFLSWDTVSDRPIIGIDNLWIRAKRPGDFSDRVKPLLNIGGLVKYPMGKGGIILNQLKIQERETVPVNRQKKQTIFVSLMRNLNGVFTGGRVILPGENLLYEPVSLEGRCNLYITADRGWPDRDHDFSHLPLDRQKFSGVSYIIRDFKTSPLENGITLSGMPGPNRPDKINIEVNKKADAIFFLHTFYQKQEWRPRERRREQPPVVFQYIMNYADDKKEVIDVRYGEGIAQYIQSEPVGLKNASLAWAAPFPRDKSKFATLYQMQWNNPRPDIEIKSIDITNSSDGRQWGAPAILAITLARESSKQL